MEYLGLRPESLCPGGVGCWDWRCQHFLVVFSCSINCSWLTDPYKWWNSSTTASSQCLTLSSFVLFSKKTVTGFFANRHQPCQQIDCGKCESLWPTSIGCATDIFTLLAKFKVFRLALYNVCFFTVQMARTLMTVRNTFILLLIMKVKIERIDVIIII